MLNPFKQLLRLLPDPPLLVGEVVSFSNGVATIEEPGGGLSQARGDVTVGDRVFFRNGVIEGPAPALSFVAITV